MATRTAASKRRRAAAAKAAHDKIVARGSVRVLACGLRVAQTPAELAVSAAVVRRFRPENARR